MLYFNPVNMPLVSFIFFGKNQKNADITVCFQNKNRRMQNAFADFSVSMILKIIHCTGNLRVLSSIKQAQQSI